MSVCNSEPIYAVGIPRGRIQRSHRRNSVGMNRHSDHDHHGHVNGTLASSDEQTEAALDAYEEQLTNEAVVDQVKVLLFRQTFLRD